ncbi:hypothetical protein THTE_3988 [Thermogutta terrifontis]|uniref:DUF6513 domain-containing protein n=1 Tax=Thermogutta terrifontis TaxID=1331910 RepID=A0A286RKT1_9BACT|nr:DUF6513 domain-containing protein [Thermogutta terrifontis]ASV76589.1 hypothetical protein THTE_3988 [Thermogutta terrifontis]
MDSADRGFSEHFLFVTGRLAEPLLRRMLPDLASSYDFQYSVAVMPISIAGLMSVPWIAERLKVPPEATRVLLPGRCSGDPHELEAKLRIPVERGPNDLHDLPEYFRRRHRPCLPQDEYSLRIVAVVKDAADVPLPTLLDLADRLVADGADVIGLWHEDREPRPQFAKIIKALHSHGHKVWVRTLELSTWQAALAAGADFVEPLLEVPEDLPEQTNLVIEPYLPGTWEGVEETLESLRKIRRPTILKQSLVPVGLGFTQSMLRSVEARHIWPDIPLALDLCSVLFHSAADAGPLLLLLLGFAQEIGARWILTTQEVNTARTSVRECDVIRRMVHCAQRYHVSLRSLDSSLAMLRDHHINNGNEEYWQQLREQIRDPSPRLFVKANQLCAWAFGRELQSSDPYELFEAITDAAKDAGRPLDPDTAFYLGYELCKAAIARQLGKNYWQDEALHWGLHTVAEPSPRERRIRRLARRRSVKGCSETGKTAHS